MFAKVLIANRGEIACRVIRACRRLGVATVVVYSDADARAVHVEMADEAVRIGPPPAAESYLKGEAIIDAARATGADAIHPGYGFLSENPDFVEAVEAAGLVFIGPSAVAIRAMGLKDSAKRLVAEAGAPVVPGYHGEDQSADRLAAEAEAIGYPVLIKARAGGGGKGMRRVERAEDFAAALDGARREAEAAFGDGACLIEKWIATPRHIEIQVFGDSRGDVIHLFERDCSLQRRHQKVIEEAPAPGMTAAMRAAMGAAAVRAAKAIGYVGAGTVEFIVDATEGLREDRFYFMEMNTRLQVEHPVTEAVTGVDLVEWQLRVAGGEPLPMAQEDLSLIGWAFEARLYAEDAAKGFLPATGTLRHLHLPERAARIDSGVREGDAIQPFYDPMIAKLIVHGATRAAALNRLSAALAACRVAGTVTNLGFLAALAAHDGFRRGEVDTGLIDRDLDALTAPPPPNPVAAALAALAALGLTRPPEDADPWAALTGWRLWGPAAHLVEIGGEAARVSVRGPGAFAVEIGGATTALALSAGEAGALRIETGGRRLTAAAIRHGETVTVFLEGRARDYVISDPMIAGREADSAGDALIAPMPGLVKLVSTAQGATVAKGDALIVLEAMKMEHTLKAPRDGVVAELSAESGEQVAEGAVLLTLEAEDG